MLSLTVRQVIQSGSCLVNGSVFSVTEAYECAKCFIFIMLCGVSWTPEISVVHSL